MSTVKLEANSPIQIGKQSQSAQASFVRDDSLTVMTTPQKLSDMLAPVVLSTAMVDKTIMLKCSISRDLPNQDLAAQLTIEYTDKLKQMRENAEDEFELWDGIYNWMNMVWAAGGAVVGMVGAAIGGGGGAKVATIAWGWLAKMAESSYASHLDALQAEIDAGVVSEDILAQLGIIAGSEDAYQDIADQVNQIPADQLNERLESLDLEAKALKAQMEALETIPLVGLSLPNKIGYYASRATIEMNIVAICDRMRSVQPDVPQSTVSMQPYYPDYTSPSESGFSDDSGGREDKKGSLLPLLFGAAAVATLLI